MQNLCVTAFQRGEKGGEGSSDAILKSVSFDMYSGDRIAIVGNSGSGKTTLLKAIAGVLPHSLNVSGSVYIQEDDVAYIMQEPKSALNPIRTVRNMFLALRYKKHRGITRQSRKHVQHSKKQIFENMHNTFEAMNLFNSSDDTHNVKKLLSKRRTHISGGMAQRIMVALAIASGSRLALADEVSSALDEAHTRKTIEMLLKTMKSVLFVTHRMSIIKSYCNKVLVLHNGKVHFFGMIREWLRSNDDTQFVTDFIRESIVDRKKPQESRQRKEHPYFSSIFTPIRLENSKPILCCECISACYSESSIYNLRWCNVDANTTVFQDLDFAAQVGEVVCIRGETGCGKSTFAHICAGYIRPSSGFVSIHDKPMPYGISRAMRIFRRDVQLISQVPSLSFNPLRSIFSGIMDAYSTLSLAEKKRKAEYLRYLCQRMQISHTMLNRFSHQLSGGQMQRMSIIRALLPCPKILILDEPVSHLDPHIRGDILELLCSIHAETGITLIMISHLQDIHVFMKNAYPHFTSYTLAHGRLTKQ